VGIHWLLHSSCCFLNTNTAIMRRLIWTARTLEAEWWQVCREAWVQGQRKMSKYWAHLGCWISPCYCPFSLVVRFETYEPFISLIFQVFSGHGKLQTTETTDTGVRKILNLHCTCRTWISSTVCIIISGARQWIHSTIIWCFKCCWRRIKWAKAISNTRSMTWGCGWNVCIGYWWNWCIKTTWGILWLNKAWNKNHIP